MSRPDHAFRSDSHIFHATERPGTYRAEPGGALIHLSVEKQTLPPRMVSPDLVEAVECWLIARGARRVRLNMYLDYEIRPELLDWPPAGPVRRLVSIAPSNAEIVGALGAAGLLVGAESSSDFPPEIAALPRLGPDLNVNMERLAALQPDLVLAALSVPGMERNVTALRQRRIPHLVLAPRNVAEIQADIQRVGDAIGFAARAREVVAEMERRLGELRARAPAQPVPVYLEWWPKPMFTPGGLCWTNDLIAAAGGVNVFRGLPAQSQEVLPEDLARADPSVIFLSWCGVPFDQLNVRRVLERPVLESVTAVRERQVHALDESLLGRPGPRVVEGAARMAQIIRAAAR
jgi:iron complex transport system substrate-binding protein